LNPEFEAVLVAIIDLADRASLVKAVQQAQFLMECSRLSRPANQQGTISNSLLMEAPAAMQLPTWRRLLAIQLSGYNGCRVIRGQSPRNSLWIVGRDITIKSVRRVYLPLTVKLEELAQIAQPTQQEIPQPAKRQWFRKWKSQWRISLVHDLDYAMEAGVKEAQESMGLYPDASLRWEQKTVLRWMKQYLQLMPLRRNVSKN
jgi:hypothetical protein